MIGFVYAIADSTGTAVKIGWAKDPVRRLSELNVGSPYDHALVGYQAGDKSTEAGLHIRFSAFRIRGEWFRHEGPVAEFTASLPPHLKPAPPKTEIRGSLSARSIIELWPSAEIFADEIGLKWRSHARVMKVRNSISPLHWSAVIAAASRIGVVITEDDLRSVRAAS